MQFAVAVRVARRQWLGLLRWAHSNVSSDYEILHLKLAAKKVEDRVLPQLVHGAMEAFVDGTELQCRSAFAGHSFYFSTEVVLRISIGKTETHKVMLRRSVRCFLPASDRRHIACL